LLNIVDYQLQISRVSEGYWQ